VEEIAQHVLFLLRINVMQTFHLSSFLSISDPKDRVATVAGSLEIGSSSAAVSVVGR